MCGIMAAVAGRDIVPLLVEGIKRLEYRGYDSCGIAVYQEGLRRARSTGGVTDLGAQIQEQSMQGSMGIAHTRWATHGAPSTDNAHPHFSGDRVAVVHNGIIENHAYLRQKLEKAGYQFTSQTD